MNLIQYRNFRGVPDNMMCKVPFGNITMLVGKNNSGKSTMVKALLLMLEYLKSDSVANFDFANENLENANVVTFGRAKNKYSDKDFINFALNLDHISIDVILSGLEEETSGRVVVLNITYHDPSIFEMGNMIRFEIAPHFMTVYHSRKEAQFIPEFSPTQSLITNIEIKIESLKGLLKNLDKSSSEFLEKNHELQTLKAKRKKLIESISNKKNDNYEIALDYQKDSSLKDLLESVFDKAKTLDFDQFKKNKKLKGVEAKKKFTNFLTFQNQYENAKIGLDHFFSTIADLKIYYLPANPTKQSALFAIKDKQNALAQAIHEFYQIIKNTKEGEAYRFVKKWMSLDNGFEIGDDIEVIQRASEAYEVNIQVNDKTVPLADKGMGSIQAMLLIFRIAVIIEKIQQRKYKPLVIIEEPELNLHPALQSRLCDFFLEVHEKYGINFIIETHSEYLIRKSQLFVKDREYEHESNENPFSVIYFDKDGMNCYPMEYREDGKFKNEFGTGFFDEAANLTIDLF